MVRPQTILMVVSYRSHGRKRLGNSKIWSHEACWLDQSSFRRKTYAVVQLRRDNALGTLYNIVGFQTKMKYGAQKEILRMIPGLEEAKFARLGGIHRNSFINSPSLLDQQLRFKAQVKYSLCWSNYWS